MKCCGLACESGMGHFPLESGITSVHLSIRLSLSPDPDSCFQSLFHSSENLYLNNSDLIFKSSEPFRRHQLFSKCQRVCLPAFAFVIPGPSSAISLGARLLLGDVAGLPLLDCFQVTWDTIPSTSCGFAVMFIQLVEKGKTESLAEGREERACHKSSTSLEQYLGFCLYKCPRFHKSQKNNCADDLHMQSNAVLESGH